jgi:hypothetical protein
MRLISAIISERRPAMPSPNFGAPSPAGAAPTGIGGGIAGAAAGGRAATGRAAVGGAAGLAVGRGVGSPLGGPTGAAGFAAGGAIGGPKKGAAGGAVGGPFGGPAGGRPGTGADGTGAAATPKSSPRRIASASPASSTVVAIAGSSPSMKSKTLPEGRPGPPSVLRSGKVAVAMGVTCAVLRSVRILLRLCWNSTTCFAISVSASARSPTDFERNSETRMRMASLSEPDMFRHHPAVASVTG